MFKAGTLENIGNTFASLIVKYQYLIIYLLKTLCVSQWYTHRIYLIIENSEIVNIYFFPRKYSFYVYGPIV